MKLICQGSSQLTLDALVVEGEFLGGTHKSGVLTTSPLYSSQVGATRGIGRSCVDAECPGRGYAGSRGFWRGLIRARGADS